MWEARYNIQRNNLARDMPGFGIEFEGTEV